MALSTSDYGPIEIGSWAYLLLLVADRSCLEDDNNRPLVQRLKRFCDEDLRPHVFGGFTTPHSANANYQKIMLKRWSSEKRTQLEDLTYPKVLVIGVNFEDFQPDIHDHAIVEFAEFRNIRSAYQDFLRKAAAVIREGQPFYSWYLARSPISEAELSSGQLDIAQSHPQVLSDWRTRESVKQCEAAQILGVSRRTIYNYLERGQLQPTSNRRVQCSSIEAFLDNTATPER